MLSRIVLLSLPSAVYSYAVVEPVSLATFKEEYNSNLPDVNTGTDAALKILKLNNYIRGTSEPPSTDADAQKLWAWYSEVDGTAKTGATAYLTKVETDNLVHEQMLTSFNTKLQAALTQATTAGAVATDAKNYAAIVGDTEPVVSTTILQSAKDAHDILQRMSTANQAKAKASAETRLYDSWAKRFKALVDAARFGGTTGFQYIVKCLKETLQTTACTDDTDAGESSWAVYNRVSSVNKAKLKAAIVAQMTTSVSAVPP